MTTHSQQAHGPPQTQSSPRKKQIIHDGKQLHAIALLDANAAKAPYANTAVRKTLNPFFILAFIFVLLLVSFHKTNIQMTRGLVCMMR